MDMEALDASEAQGTHDMANAARLVAAHRDTLRYVMQWGWMVHDGARWVRDETDAVLDKAMGVVRAMRHEAADEPDGKRREELWKWARASSFESRLHAMVNLAKPQLAATVEQFDAHPWLLNCANVTVDLRTGVTHTHNPGDMLTHCCPVPYDPDARSEVWEKFVNDIMCGDADMVAYLQRAIGYSLTGVTSEKGLFFCYGSQGDNGKSTLLEAIRYVLGDGYARCLPVESLLKGHKSSVPNDIARLTGARFVTAIEPAKGQKLDESRVKQLTGNDTITARHMREAWFDFRPVLKLWVAANDRPELEDTAESAWGRLFVVPFNAYYPKGHPDRDETMPAKLREAAPAILAWAVRGCRQWQAEGLNPPEKVKRASQEYRDLYDPVGRFVRERCTRCDGKTVLKDFTDAYTRWAQAEGDTSDFRNSRQLRKALEGQGFVVDRGNGNKPTVFGLVLRPGEDDTPANVTPLRQHAAGVLGDVPDFALPS